MLAKAAARTTPMHIRKSPAFKEPKFQETELLRRSARANHQFSSSPLALYIELILPAYPRWPRVLTACLDFVTWRYRRYGRRR